MTSTDRGIERESSHADSRSRVNSLPPKAFRKSSLAPLMTPG